MVLLLFLHWPISIVTKQVLTVGWSELVLIEQLSALEVAFMIPLKHIENTCNRCTHYQIQ